MSTLQQIRLEGDAHVEAGRLPAAIECFQNAVDLFMEQRTAEAAAVEEFVHAAGSLCMCYHAAGELDRCVRTARELISIYPVIPKAYGAMGMSIVDRLASHEATMRAGDAAGAGGQTGEHIRSDPRRYLTQLGGVLCSADDAHVCICRSVLLSDGALQPVLGPYCLTAVRLISEQTISGTHALERQYGDALLDTLCPLEAPLAPGPVLLATAPPAVRDTVRAVDPSRREEAIVPPREAAAILAEVAAQQEQQREHGGSSGGEGLRQPVDFTLSGAPTAVRVCHAEKGGLPRGLTLASATRPFAVAAWVLPAPVDPTAVAAVAKTERGQPAGPTEALALPAPSPEVLVQALGEVGGGSDPAAGPPPVYCACCGKEVELAAALAGTTSGCSVCGGVCYCSQKCEAAYRRRHDDYECRLQVRLHELLAASHAECGKNGGSEAAEHDGDDDDEAADLPGSAWSTQHLLHRVLPLAIAVYSGLCARETGHERVAARLRGGVHRWALAALHPAVTDVLRELAVLVEEGPLVAEYGVPAEALLHRLLLGARLYQCPPPLVCATESDRCHHAFSFFYSERLLLRHSCEPNCVWVGPLRAVVTGRLIAKGEELTLAVADNEGSVGTRGGAEPFPQHWPWQIRNKWLRRHHAFECGCARCERERDMLNPARGDLASDTVEQLLTADRLERVGGEVPAEALTHPTHHFHPRLQQVIRQSLRLAARGTELDVERALNELDRAATEAAAHLLPTHYLFQDLRAAVMRVAAGPFSGGEALQRLHATGRASLLFYEAMWAGAVAPKRALMAGLPPPTDGGSAAAGRRRAAMARRALLSSASSQASPPAGSDEGAGGGAQVRRRRTRPQPVRDDGEGTLVDRFFGSYRAWYAL